MAMTTKELDVLQCSSPDCNHSSHDDTMFFHSRCHPGTPTWAVYSKGVLTIECAACNNIVTQIAVAKSEVV